MTYSQHSTWTTFLIQAMQRDPPPGYSRPSLHQIMMCDKAAFTSLASSRRAVRQEAGGTFPLGERLLELRSDPTIALHLAPLVKAAASQPSNPRPGPYNAAPHRLQAPSFEKKGKGKGRKGKAPPMPVELRKKWHRTTNGDPLCFGFNTAKGCEQAQARERCNKGWRLCAEPKCLQAHSLLNHPKKS